MMDNSFMSIAKPLINEMNKKTEDILQTQLSELVSRGILIAEITHPTLVKNADGKIEILQQVRLVLKDQEYIEQLEKKVRHYDAILDLVREGGAK